MTDFRDTVIVSDVDGTFLGKKSEIVERNIRAVDWLTGRGGGFALSTGRMPCDIGAVIGSIRSVANLPCICCNGTLLADLGTGITISEYPLDHSRGGELVRYISEHWPRTGIRISTPDGFVTSEKMLAEPRLARDINGVGKGRTTVCDFPEWDRFKWYKFVVRGEPSLLDEVRKDVERRFPEHAVYSKSGPAIFEVQTHGVTKATMLSDLRRIAGEKNGGRKVRIVCCGDYDNDLAMLKAADLSVCPANALPGVREICDLCLCECSKGLIADLVEHLAAEKGISVAF